MSNNDAGALLLIALSLFGFTVVTDSPTQTQIELNPNIQTSNYNQTFGENTLTVYYNYFMTISGANYQILDSARTLLYSDSSSSDAFNYLNGVLVAGDRVYVEAGAYLVDATWYINIDSISVTFASTLPNAPNNMGNLVGSGTPGAILTNANSLNDPTLWVNGDHVIITGLTANGNAANQLYGDATAPVLAGWPDPWISGVYLNGQYDLIQFSTIYNFRLWGVWVYEAYSGISNCVIHDVGANGFMAYQYGATVVNQAYAINSEIYRCSDVGLNSQAQNTIFTGNYVHDICANGELNGIVQPHGTMDSYWGIGWEDSGYGNCGGTGSGSYTFCAGNVITNSNTAILVYEGGGTIHYALISGNTITNCGGYYGALEIYSSYSIVSHNSLTNCVTPISVGGNDMYGHTMDGNYVYGNTYNAAPIGSGSPYIRDLGTSTIYVQPSVVAFAVTSSPTGNALVSADGSYGYAGVYSTPPYITYGVATTAVALVANNQPTYTFTDWSDSGAQSHAINIPSSYTVYTATYNGSSIIATLPWTADFTDLSQFEVYTGTWSVGP